MENVVWRSADLYPFLVRQPVAQQEVFLPPVELEAKPRFSLSTPFPLASVSFSKALSTLFTALCASLSAGPCPRQTIAYSKRCCRAEPPLASFHASRHTLIPSRDHFLMQNCLPQPSFFSGSLGSIGSMSAYIFSWRLCATSLGRVFPSANGPPSAKRLHALRRQGYEHSAAFPRLVAM